MDTIWHVVLKLTSHFRHVLAHRVVSILRSYAGFAEHIVNRWRQPGRANCVPASYLSLVTLVAARRISRTSKMLNQSPQILLIEGDRTLLEITAFRLELLGYQVITLDSAERALEWLKDQLPELVIVDHVLPGIDGIEFINRLSNDTRTSDIPIMFLSTNGDLEDVQKAYNAGADEYLVIPYDPMVLEAKIERLTSAAEMAQRINSLSRSPDYAFSHNFHGQTWRHPDPTRLGDPRPARSCACCSRFRAWHAWPHPRAARSDHDGSAWRSAGRQFGVPFAEVVPQAVNPQVVRLLPEKLARQRSCVPICVAGSTMQLAMVAPDDIETISEVELITGYHIDPVVALEAPVQATLDRGFDERIVARQTIVDMKMADLEAAEDAVDEELTTTPRRNKNKRPVVRLVRAILMGAINANTSDIHLEPHIPEMRVRYRVDGELQPVMTIPNHIEEAVVARIKVHGRHGYDGESPPARRPSQCARSRHQSEFPCKHDSHRRGEKVVMRLLDEGSKTFELQHLGMCDRDLKALKP